MSKKRMGAVVAAVVLYVGAAGVEPAAAGIGDHNWASSSGACWGTYGSNPANALGALAKLDGGNGTVSCWVQARVQGRKADTTLKWFTGNQAVLGQQSAVVATAPYNTARTNVGAKYPA